MNNPSLKLYQVIPRNPRLGAHVIAFDATEAYEILRKFLDKKDWGFTKDREMDRVILIADSYEYSIERLLLFTDRSAELIGLEGV